MMQSISDRAQLFHDTAEAAIDDLVQAECERMSGDDLRDVINELGEDFTFHLHGVLQGSAKRVNLGKEGARLCLMVAAHMMADTIRAWVKRERGADLVAAYERGLAEADAEKSLGEFL
jgi:hypothetical protein